jgi:hypothetical protein
MLLKSKQETILFPAAPFNFDATMHKPDHFPTSGKTCSGAENTSPWTGWRS